MSAWQIQQKIHLKSGCSLKFSFSADDKIYEMFMIYTYINSLLET